jgi:hypothetical protein
MQFLANSNTIPDLFLPKLQHLIYKKYIQVIFYLLVSHFLIPQSPYVLSKVKKSVLPRWRTINAGLNNAVFTAAIIKGSCSYITVAV